MSRWKLRVGLVFLLLGVAVGFVHHILRREDQFLIHPLPLSIGDRLFDIGVVDADGDGNLDLFTSNHHFRQVLWLGDGKGGFRDVFGDWGLDQSRDFPLAELSFLTPPVDKPGVYLYWRGTQFVIQTHRIAELPAWQGAMKTLDPVKITSGEGFKVLQQDVPAGRVVGTALGFETGQDGKLVVVPGGQGLPLEFEFGGDIRPEQIFVGLGRVSPRSTRFALAMQDRHGHAWADINADGVLDIFITRGALAGTLPKLPPEAARGIRDELLVSEVPGRFRDRTLELGIEKKGCSGRHASWVDVDRDGVLELFVNCYDREAVDGDYAKQLYRRGADGVYRDVAADFGLGLPAQQMGSYAWFDVDGDGDVDLLAYQNEGIFLYRNASGRFVQEPVVVMNRTGAGKIGRDSESTWFYDGKMIVADIDGDGDVDAFVSSKSGNALLINREGKLAVADLASLGLPDRSMAGAFVDYDNDGLLDLYLVPNGLFRRTATGQFESMGLLAVNESAYRAAIANWFDLDNDGRMDFVLAVNPNPEYKPWWHLGKRPVRGSSWELQAHRNTGATRHWLQIELQGPDGNRQGIGAVVSVEAGATRQTRIVGAADGSFFSQGHYRTYFGLGDQARATRVRVQWTDGVVQDLGPVDGDRVLKVSRP